MPDYVPWQSKGWPEATLERAVELRVRRADIDRWLQRGKSAIRRIQRDLDRRERMIAGTLRVREATWDDDEALAEWREAFDNGWRNTWWGLGTPIDVLLDPIRDDPRFRALVQDTRDDLDRQRQSLVREGLASDGDPSWQ